ncbi:hypothetical protein AVEN_161442-1 [Araneus ventricosus]|uniref:Uncharacterized protein n=1 Tax=Araneus ventricosus TaxID=182803 RepID=A0A4Y2QGV1_ARAVE|nr:hypothetical protein AVEN_161442-1 [Araneus ventricosus]
MTIQKVIMGSMQVSGGLTLGRNMFDSVIERCMCTMQGSLRMTEAVEAFARVTGIFCPEELLQNSDLLDISDDSNDLWPSFTSDEVIDYTRC